MSIVPVVMTTRLMKAEMRDMYHAFQEYGMAVWTLATYHELIAPDWTNVYDRCNALEEVQLAMQGDFSMNDWTFGINEGDMWDHKEHTEDSDYEDFDDNRVDERSICGCGRRYPIS